MCTRIANAPNGVKVLDRTTGQTVTWQNGTSVMLLSWSTDISRQCGVKDPVVWSVGWSSGGTWHWAVLGAQWTPMYFSNEWRDYEDQRHRKLDDYYVGRGQGPCPTYYWT
ncbi:hypothetical protein [Streptomyces chilikensis]|uniref:Secreted protein n=1 Tax=Streptomyces chilikensis TaxID=1194079 RepID=A0ABV3EJ93_9ACTN